MIEKWRSDINHISIDVINLYHSRIIYMKLYDIVDNNPKIQVGNALYDWLSLNYVISAATTILRLLDRDSRTISLYNLIDSINSNKEYITREWYISQFPESFRYTKYRDKEFDDLARDNLDVLDSADLLSKLQTTQLSCEIIKVYVDKLVAHTDRGVPDRLPKYGELDKAIDAIIDLFQHLNRILNQTAGSIRITDEFVWEQLLEEPWIISNDKLNY